MYERRGPRIEHNTPIDDALDAIQDEIRKRRHQRTAIGPPRPAHEPRAEERAQAKDAPARLRSEGCRAR